MIPSIFVFLDALPLTTTGKVNRQALPEPEMTRPTLNTTFVVPQTDLERQLATLCEEVLDICPIGVEDNLLDLGMHSIQALRLLVEITGIGHKGGTCTQKLHGGARRWQLQRRLLHPFWASRCFCQ